MTIDLNNSRVKKLKKGIIKLVKDASIDDLVEIMEFVETKLKAKGEIK